MNCSSAQPLIHAYADAELDASAVLELEQHLLTCANCRAALATVQALKKSLKQDKLYFNAPFDLRQQIKAALPQPQPAAKSEPRSSLAWNWNWLTTALSGAFAVALLLVTTLNHRAADQLTSEIVASHVRSLMANHLMDVVSTDQHTVKPWFNGKLDFAPPIHDLAAQEFPLVGGRLDYLAGHTVAALIFQRHKHYINLFIWPAKESVANPAALPAPQGYHLIHWSNGEMTFWAVSDLNETELLEFANDFQNQK